MADEKEALLLAKTKEGNFEKIIKEVEKAHSYKIPCIVKIRVEANEKYNRWVLEQLK